MTYRAANLLFIFTTALLAVATSNLCAQSAHVQVSFSERLGAMDIDHMALGQGGLSDEPMWADPKAIRGTIEYVQGLLREHPGLKPETILDEWNMDLMNPPLDPRFQPCFNCETIWQMKQAGLDYSCYYHIRDWYVSFEQFKPFMSGKGTAFMTRWWNRMPQFDGLFDFQNQVRPAYFAFKLLSRLGGQRLRVASDHASVHGFATHDDPLRTDNLLLWNFSPSPLEVEIALNGIPSDKRVRHIVLEAQAAGSDENLRLRPEPFSHVEKGDRRWDIALEPYAIHYWYFE